MPYRIYWYDNSQKYIILEGWQLTWEEFFAAFEESSVLMEHVTHPIASIHIIDKFPRGLISPQLRQIMKQRPSVIKVSVVVLQGNHPVHLFIKAMTETISRTMQSDHLILFAPDLEEAVRKAEQALNAE